MTVGLGAERKRFREQHAASAPEYIWNPAEWSRDELDLRLAPELSALCESVNQDIWQNDRQAEADEFLLKLAKAVQKEELPVRLTDDFVSIAIALDLGAYAGQVAGQVDRKTARALRRSGLL